jgi:chloramphenicol O-acetyltransferase type A
MIPWLEFTAFNVNVFNEGTFLLPIFTMGKFFDRNSKRFLPLAVQFHHAVCDGYHIGLFVETLQAYIDQF